MTITGFSFDDSNLVYITLYPRSVPEDKGPVMAVMLYKHVECLLFNITVWYGTVMIHTFWLDCGAVLHKKIVQESNVALTTFNVSADR